MKLDPLHTWDLTYPLSFGRFEPARVKPDVSITQVAWMAGSISSQRP